MWKVSAVQYVEMRRLFAALDEEHWQAYYDKWLPWANQQLLQATGERLDKAIGFFDALEDEDKRRMLETPAWDTGERPTIATDPDLIQLLDYLYVEQEE